jgi:hypothetical protein
MGDDDELCGSAAIDDELDSPVSAFVRARAFLNGPPVVIGNARLNRHGIALTGGFLIAALVARVLSPGPPEPFHPKTWDPQVAEIVRFIETETGKPFKHPVSTNFLAPTEFEALPFFNATGVTWSKDAGSSFLQCSEEMFDRDVGACASIQPVSGPSTSAMFLRFVGVPIPVEAKVYANPSASPDRLVPDAYAQLVSRDIVGLYDNKADVLYVRGKSVAAVQNTVAHELVHAWQDQYGLLQRDAQGADSQSLELGIVEGYAELISSRYMQSRSTAEQNVVEDAQDEFAEEWQRDEATDAALRSTAEGAIREAQLQLNSWPYTAGADFLAKKDPTSVAKLLRKRPASTWTLMRPNVSDKGRGVSVRRPKAKGPAYTPGGITIGPLYWSIGIQSVTGDIADANQFVDLWVGDEAVLYEAPAWGVCMNDRIRFVNEQGAKTGTAILKAWEAKQMHRTTVTPSSATEVDVNVCV